MGEVAELVRKVAEDFGALADALEGVQSRPSQSESEPIPADWDEGRYLDLCSGVEALSSRLMLIGAVIGIPERTRTVNGTEHPIFPYPALRTAANRVARLNGMPEIKRIGCGATVAFVGTGPLAKLGILRPVERRRDHKCWEFDPSWTPYIRHMASDCGIRIPNGH